MPEVCFVKEIEKHLSRYGQNRPDEEDLMTEIDMLEPQDWAFPVPIRFGLGCLDEIGETCEDMGIKHALIVTDKGSRKLPFISELQEYLEEAGLTWSIFSDISPNPRDFEISAGRDAFLSSEHDAIIAIGGGSAMDGGKAICLTANNEFDLWDFEWEKLPPEIEPHQDFPILTTIPTTAGTGAETDSTAMITHTGKGMKFCVCHPELKPILALLDPALTLNLPANLTAWTGADAMVHAIEAYSVPRFHPLCDGMALEALALITKWLPVAVRDPENMAARSGMMAGSCLAGIAFMKGLGNVHAISHMIGAEFDTQHGLTNAIVLPVVLRLNLPRIETKVKRMAGVIGLSDTSVEGFIAEIERILDEINIPRSLSEIGVPADCAERIAEKAMLDSAAETNPGSVTLEEMRMLVETAIHKAR